MAGGSGTLVVLGGFEAVAAMVAVLFVIVYGSAYRAAPSDASAA